MLRPTDQSARPGQRQCGPPIAARGQAEGKSAHVHAIRTEHQAMTRPSAQADCLVHHRRTRTGNPGAMHGCPRIPEQVAPSGAAITTKRAKRRPGNRHGNRRPHACVGASPIAAHFLRQSRRKARSMSPHVSHHQVHARRYCRRADSDDALLPASPLSSTAERGREATK
jgi:hypothetical protein